MKTLLLCLTILPLCVWAQKHKSEKVFKIDEAPENIKAQMLANIPTKVDKIFYDTIVRVDTSLLKTVLFTRIRQWFAEKFMDSKSVLQVDDIDNGILTGKGTYNYAIANGLNLHSGYLKFIMNVAVKDGKFRYQLYNFSSDEQNQSVLSNNSYSGTVDFDDVYKMRQDGRRQAYTRKYLSQMIDLVYFINTTLPKSVTSENISDF